MNDKNQTTVNDLKVPPHSIEAEQSVLGGLMLDSSTWDDVSIQLNHHDFYRRDHQIIFQAITHLASKEKPIDVVVLTEALKARSHIDQAGGEAYLHELTHNTPSAANIMAYANIVREKSIMRQLIHSGQYIVEQAYQPKQREISELLDDAEQKIFAIAQEKNNAGKPQEVEVFLSAVVDKLHKLQESDQAITGLATGYSDLDALTSGLQPADLVIIAGRPSMGKTALAMNIAEYAVLNSNQPVLIFSMEMPGDALVMRMLSSLGRINQQNLRKGKIDDSDWNAITSTITLLSEKPLYVDDTPGLSPGDVRSKARRLAKEHGQLGLIVVDYLQLMQVPGYRVDNRVAEISEISRSLKSLAKELNVPVIALSQLNRSLEQRAERRPMMSDLRESGAIEQDADLIAFIYRDEVYNKETNEKGIAEVIIAKQRNGPIGTVKLTFLGKYTRFENLARETYDFVE